MWHTVQIEGCRAWKNKLVYYPRFVGAYRMSNFHSRKRIVDQRAFRLVGVVAAFFAGVLAFDGEALALLPTSACEFIKFHVLHHRVVTYLLSWCTFSGRLLSR